MEHGGHTETLEISSSTKYIYPSHYYCEAEFPHHKKKHKCIWTELCGVQCRQDTLILPLKPRILKQHQNTVWLIKTTDASRHHIWKYTVTYSFIVQNKGATKGQMILRWASKLWKWRDKHLVLPTYCVHTVRMQAHCLVAVPCLGNGKFSRR